MAFRRSGVILRGRRFGREFSGVGELTCFRFLGKIPGLAVRAAPGLKAAIGLGAAVFSGGSDCGWLEGFVLGPGEAGGCVFPRRQLGLQDGLNFAAKVGSAGLTLHLILAQGGEIVGEGFFFIESDDAGIGADKASIEDAAGELVELLLFEGAEHTRADFCSAGDGVEGEAATLAVLAKFFSKNSHSENSGGRGRARSDSSS